jgi:hypothetical protein
MGRRTSLISRLWPLLQQVQELTAQVAVMQERIKELEGRLALNGKNSSKPAPKSLRLSGQRHGDIANGGGRQP